MASVAQGELEARRPRVEEREAVGESDGAHVVQGGLEGLLDELAAAALGQLVLAAAVALAAGRLVALAHGTPPPWAGAGECRMNGVAGFVASTWRVWSMLVVESSL